MTAIAIILFIVLCYVSYKYYTLNKLARKLYERHMQLEKERHDFEFRLYQAEVHLVVSSNLNVTDPHLYKALMGYFRGDEDEYD